MPSSTLYPGERIFDDATNLPPMNSGYRGMFRSAAEASSFSALPPQFMVPRHEWQARCEEIEQTKTGISHAVVRMKVPPKNQDRTDYCWFFGPVGCFEGKRALQNQPYVSLSPSSGAAPIKGFRSEGGYGVDAMNWLKTKGVVPSSVWGDTVYNNRKLYSEANKKLALTYRTDEWDNLVAGGSIDESASCLFHRMPVTIGLNWWRHQIWICDPLWLDGELAWRCRQSYGDSDEYPNGFFVLRGQKMRPDDACCLRSALAS